MEMSIIINIPKNEAFKNSALMSRQGQQNISIVKSTLSVNSILKKNPPVGTLSEQLSKVVSREFAKIKIPV